MYSPNGGPVMMSNRKLAKIVLLFTLVVTLLLQGCCDLGGYTDEEMNDASEIDYEKYYKPYYDTFGDIQLMKQDTDNEEFDLMDSFFNNSTVNDFKWDDEDDEVKEDEYAYMAIEVDKDFKCDSLSLYMKANVTANMKIYAFKADDYDQSCTYDEIKKEYDEMEEGDEEPKLSDYDELADATPLAETTVKLKEGQWVSFSIVFFQKGKADKQPIEFEDGDYIILRFENNTGFGYKAELEKIKFTTTNLLIRKHDD